MSYSYSSSTTTTRPTRKPSLRQKLRDSFRASSIRKQLDLPPQHEGNSSKRASLDILEEGSWLGRKRRKNRQAKEDGEVQRQHNSTLEELKIDVGGLEELRLSFDEGEGSELFSLGSPRTVRTAETEAETIRPERAEEKIAVVDTVMKDAPPMELEDTSGNVVKSPEADPAATVHQPPEHIPVLKKGPKYQIKMDNLVRPVSRATANPLSENISKTLETINKNSFSTGGKLTSPVDNISTARQSIESSRSKALTAIEKVDSVHGSSNASVHTTATTSTRRPLTDSNRANNFAANRHSVGDIDKMMSTTEQQENKRQSFPPVAARRQSLMNMSPTQQRPRSPTGSISSVSSVPRPRVPSSGSVTAQRLAWIKELEAGGRRTSGQEYMSRKLEGGVAEKLRRFESAGGSSSTGTGTGTTTGLRRTYSNASRVSAAGSDAYGIEAGMATKRISRNVTHDDEFRRKLEEKIGQKKKEEDEEREKARKKMMPPQQVIDFVEAGDGDHEAKVDELMKREGDVAREIDEQARLAAREEKRDRRQGKIFEHYPGQKARIVDVRGGPQKPGAVMQSAAAVTVARNVAEAPEVKKVDIRGGPLKPVAVMQSAQKADTPNVEAKKPALVALKKAETPVVMPVHADDGEYDPFNYASYPVRSSVDTNPPQQHKLVDAEKKEYGGRDENERPVVVGGPMKFMSPADEKEDAGSGELENDDGDGDDAAQDFKPRGGLDKIENVLRDAGADMEAPLPSDAPEAKSVEKQEPVTTESFTPLEVRGGPEKISAILESAGVDMDAALPSDVEDAEVAEKTVTNATQKEQEKKDEPKTDNGQFSPVQVRGGPQKPLAVMESAGVDMNAALPSDVISADDSRKATFNATPAPQREQKKDEPEINDIQFTPVQIRGGPHKPLAVMESAAAARETTTSVSAPTPTTPEKTPTSPIKRKPAKLRNGSQKATSALLVEERNVEIRGGPQKPVSVLESSLAMARRQTPSSLLLANGSVKVASPCSSPTEFTAAALPRFGRA